VSGGVAGPDEPDHSHSRPETRRRRKEQKVSRFAIPMKRTSWELIPAGNYLLELTDVRDGPVFPGRNGAPEPTTKLVLQVSRGPHKGMEVTTLINQTATGPKSNSRRWAEALSGHDPEDGELFDPMDYVGCTVWGKVDVQADGQGVDRNRISVVMSLLALEAQMAGTTAAPRPVGGLEPSGGMPPKPAPSRPGPDRELELPDEAWDGLEPPPAEEAS